MTALVPKVLVVVTEIDLNPKARGGMDATHRVARLTTDITLALVPARFTWFCWIRVAEAHLETPPASLLLEELFPLLFVVGATTRMMWNAVVFSTAALRDVLAAGAEGCQTIM